MPNPGIYYQTSGYYGQAGRQPFAPNLRVSGVTVPPSASIPPTPPPDFGGTPAQPPASQAPQAPAAPSLGNIDFSNDPILSRIRALGQESIAQAEAEAKAARTKLVIGYGDPALAQKLGLSGKTGRQAGQNPFSTVAELGRTYTRRNTFDITRPLSDQHNLFYSTERGRQLALSGEQDLRDRARAEAAVQEQMTSISNAVIQAKMAAQAQQIQAEQEAYNRALQQALYAAGASSSLG